METPAPGLILAAPSSGSGKTTLALALMRAFHRQGLRVAPAKIGPDYIDPGFHSAACGRVSLNLDPWAMRPDTRAALVRQLSAEADLILCEGVMGLFDGAADGTGSTADLAAETGWPVLLLVDVRGQSASAAALVRGFASHRGDVRIAGVIFNQVGSPRHAAMLTRAMADSLPNIPVLGCLPRAEGLALASRHLGLVQAGEHQDIDALLSRAADWVTDHADLDAIRALAAPGHQYDPETIPLPPPLSPPLPPPLPPLGQRIAVAQDVAFAFSYPHILEGWRAAGAEILPFSPLADAAPDATADAVYLPGGYPELYPAQLAASRTFLQGLRDAADRDAAVYGECGGYMVLGQTLTDAEGTVHEMAGLLPLQTSFASRRLHLGYRRATVLADTAPWPKGTRLTGHEFHYATVVSEPEGQSLFQVADALGAGQASVGLTAKNVCGSFLHLIDLFPTQRAL